MAAERCHRHGGTVPPLRLLVPPILVYSEYFFEVQRNDKTMGKDGKRNNNKNYSRLKFSPFFAILLAIDCCS